MESESGPLSSFIQELSRRLKEQPNRDNKTLATQGVSILRKFLQDFSLPEKYTYLEGGRVRSYLLYKDAELGFTMASIVWPPKGGMATHNHKTGWTLYGVYENEIEVTNYHRIDEGTDKNRAHFKISQRQAIPRGQVIILHEPDFDMHRVVNPTLKRSITIHVWGRDPAEISRETFPRLSSATSTSPDEEVTGIEPLNTVYDNCKEAYEPAPGGYLRIKKEFQMT